MVLDEPTNDLDMETLDLLQEVIADYDGTVLIVSHDRYFLDRTVTAVVGLDGSGKADIVAGGYKDWESRRKPQPAESSAAPKGRPAPSAPKVQTKLSFKEKFELEQLPERIRSDEPTSELQSLMRIASDAFCLKKQTKINV